MNIKIKVNGWCKKQQLCVREGKHLSPMDETLPPMVRTTTAEKLSCLSSLHCSKNHIL